MLRGTTLLDGKCRHLSALYREHPADFHLIGAYFRALRGREPFRRFIRAFQPRARSLKKTCGAFPFIVRHPLYKGLGKYARCFINQAFRLLSELPLTLQQLICLQWFLS